MLFEAQSLAARRGARTVFRDISFSLSAGDALLVTGPNGSGKSSLLRVLAGLLPPTGGGLLWRGQPLDSMHKTRLHYLGHLDAAKPELTAAEMIGYWSALLAPEAAPKTLLKIFGLEPLADRPIRYLSAGQKRRLALTRLMLQEAPLWLLDEPATSLDHDGRDLLVSLIAQHRAKGGIAIIAAHQDIPLPDAQNLTLGHAA